MSKSIENKRISKIIKDLKAECHFYKQCDKDMTFSTKFLVSLLVELRRLEISRQVDDYCLEQIKIFKDRKDRISADYIVSIYDNIIFMSRFDRIE